MFGDLMNNMQEQQESLKAELAQQKISEISGDQGISITADGNGVIKQIEVNESLLDVSRKEELEDLLIIHLNNVKDQAKEKETAATQKMMEQIMPPGLGDLSSIFGK